MLHSQSGQKLNKKFPLQCQGWLQRRQPFHSFKMSGSLHQYFHCRRRIFGSIATLDPCILRACLSRLAAGGTPLTVVFAFAPVGNTTPIQTLDRYVSNSAVSLEAQLDLVDALADHDLHNDPKILRHAMEVGNALFAVALFQRGVKPNYSDISSRAPPCEKNQTQRLFGALMDVAWVRRRTAVIFWIHAVF